VDIAIYIFEKLTALDAIGPYEVLQRLPGATVKFVGADRRPVRTEQGMLSLGTDYTRDEVTHADVLVVPGGIGTRALIEDEPTLDWIRAIDAGSTWTTSVCTGSLLLGAAGLLEGKQATTHWAVLDLLGHFGAIPTMERVVEQGKIITAAGVSSGIDMALRLAAHIAGDDVAQAIQLGIEYDPQPPFDSGSVTKAAEHIVDLARTGLQREVTTAESRSS
jgi:putative intracellular protease/amidase